MFWSCCSIAALDLSVPCLGVPVILFTPYMSFLTRVVLTCPYSSMWEKQNSFMEQYLNNMIIIEKKGCQSLLTLSVSRFETHGWNSKCVQHWNIWLVSLLYSSVNNPLYKETANKNWRDNPPYLYGPASHGMNYSSHWIFHGNSSIVWWLLYGIFLFMPSL